MKIIECHLDPLHSAAEVAERFKISSKRVRVIAKTRGVGQKLGKWGMWVFTESDIKKMETRTYGRPPASKEKR